MFEKLGVRVASLLTWAPEPISRAQDNPISLEWENIFWDIATSKF